MADRRQKIDPRILEELLIRELRRSPECAGAAGVMIDELAENDPSTNSNWGPARINPGTANIADCESALVPILRHFGALYFV